MDTDTWKKLAELEHKVDAIFTSVEKTRRYFLTIMVISVVAFLLPLLGLMFAIPSFMSSYNQLSDLGSLEI